MVGASALGRQLPLPGLGVKKEFLSPYRYRHCGPMRHGRVKAVTKWGLVNAPQGSALMWRTAPSPDGEDNAPNAHRGMPGARYRDGTNNRLEVCHDDENYPCQCSSGLDPG